MRVGIVSNSWLRARNGIANIFIRLTFCFHAAKPVFLNVHSLSLSFRPLSSSDIDLTE